MTTEPRTFPPRPLHDVKAAYIRQASCPSSVAITVSDFEPWEQGVEFEVADTSTVPGWSAEEVSELHEAFGSGVREELAELEPGTTVAVTVILRSIKVHEVDSHPWRSATRDGSPYATRWSRRTVRRPSPAGPDLRRCHRRRLCPAGRYAVVLRGVGRLAVGRCRVGRCTGVERGAGPAVGSAAPAGGPRGSPCRARPGPRSGRLLAQPGPSAEGPDPRADRTASTFPARTALRLCRSRHRLRHLRHGILSPVLGQFGPDPCVRSEGPGLGRPPL